mmetsp:Transcript_2513/g.9027  ORF Transcript_2513/g.9027 Transcript_2513/m.9027 type:complete len:489 (-) Transcript_2513:421-1887(-)
METNGHSPGDNWSAEELPPEFSNAQGKMHHSNVYVRNLQPTVGEDVLRQMFEPYGEVESVCIMRDLASRVSRGFGFVKYANFKMAVAAINGLHGSMVAGKRLEVKFANSDSVASPSSPSDNIYVKGLPAQTSEESLFKLFSPYGTVKQCRVLETIGDSGAGALVRFHSVEDAAAAVAATNGVKLPDGTGPLRVKFADTPVEKERKQQRRIAALRYAHYENTTASAENGYANGIPIKVAVEVDGEGKPMSLPSELEIPGAVQFAGMARLAKEGMPPAKADPDDAKSSSRTASPPITTDSTPAAPPVPCTSRNGNGLPAVEAASAPAAAPVSALTKGLQSVKLDAPSQYVQPQNGYHPHGEAGLNCNLYVKNLPPEADDLFLYRVFSPHGAISSVRAIMNDQTGKCRGYGFVRYVYSQNALEAIRQVHGHVRGGEQMLEVSLKTPSAKDREREVQSLNNSNGKFASQDAVHQEAMQPVYQLQGTSGEQHR